MHHVVAAVLTDGDRVLLVHRSPSRRWYPDVWDLPGGHVEPGESEPSALVRELREELGVHVSAYDDDPVARLPAADMRLAVWRVRSWRGVPVNRAPDEHDALGWFSFAALEGLPLAEGAYVPLLGAVLASP